MFIDFREKGKRWGEREKHRYERDISVASCMLTDQGSNFQPRCICALTGDQTHNLLVYGMTLQPTESPAQGRQLLSFDA